MANKRTALQYLFEVNHVSFPWYLTCMTILYATDALSGGAVARTGIVHDRLVSFLLFSGVLDVLYRVARSNIGARVLRLPTLRRVPDIGAQTLRLPTLRVPTLHLPIEQYRSLFSLFTLALLVLDIAFLIAVPLIQSPDLLSVLTSRLNTLLFLAVAIHLTEVLTTHSST